MGLARVQGVGCRVGQSRTNTPYMTIYLVISLPKIPYVHRIYMVLDNPTCLRTLRSQLSTKQRVFLVCGVHTI